MNRPESIWGQLLKKWGYSNVNEKKTEEQIAAEELKKTVEEIHVEDLAVNITNEHTIKQKEPDVKEASIEEQVPLVDEFSELAIKESFVEEQPAIANTEIIDKQLVVTEDKSVKKTTTKKTTTKKKSKK